MEGERDEKNRIEMEIMECGGDKMRACKLLGYSPDEFMRKIVKYNL